jgi:hypothetical protein
VAQQVHKCQALRVEQEYRVTSISSLAFGIRSGLGDDSLGENEFGGGNKLVPAYMYIPERLSNG